MDKVKIRASKLDENIYRSYGEFAKKHPSFAIYKFDYFLAQGLDFFTSNPNIDIPKLKETLRQIELAIPYIKQIFSKPWINLKTNAEVLPVEYVRRTNAQTFSHLSVHPELVEKIEKNQIIPSKLLSQVYADNYGIYENQIFCSLISKILTFTHLKSSLLREILLVKDRANIDFFERNNHSQYLLALGKLHISYIKEYNFNYEEILSICKEMTRLQNILLPRLKKPVYRFTKIPTKELKLKRTNLFYHDKNYSQVFKLYSYFIKNKIISNKPLPLQDFSSLNYNYYCFVELLTLFAIKHFNFTETTDTFSFDNLSISFSFKNFQIHLTNQVADQVLLFDFFKEKKYRIALVPNLYFTLEDQDYLKNKYEADAIYLSSLEERDYLKESYLFLSANNIDSFRRIQQLLLEGMLYSDTKRDTCPFCGFTLQYKKETREYTCPLCNFVFEEKICPVTKKHYLVSYSSKKEKALGAGEPSKAEELLFNEHIEETYNFKNITRLTKDLGFVCPFCQKVHSEKVTI